MKQAARMNQGKPELDCLLDFPRAMEAFCRVMEVGAAKYDRDNWKLGGKPDSEYLAAALRHMMAHRAAKEPGDLFADDTGCLHIAHAMWNLAALIELNLDVTHNKEVVKRMIDYWLTRKAADAKRSGETWSGGLAPPDAPF